MARKRYRIDFRPSVRKALGALRSKDRERVGAAITALADNLRPAGCKKLTASEGFMRIRVGDHRVVHVIEDDALLVL